MKHNWSGLVKIIDIRHTDINGNILWEGHDFYNVLHQAGEEFLLQAAFTGGRVSTVIPDNYYLGLDNRLTVSTTDVMSSLTGEPVSSGYVRQSVSSNGQFTLSLESSHYIATSPIVAFSSTTAAWGPVANLFLATTLNNSGILISTVVLPSPVSLNIGEAITMRVGLQIFDCILT